MSRPICCVDQNTLALLESEKFRSGAAHNESHPLFLPQGDNARQVPLTTNSHARDSFLSS